MGGSAIGVSLRPLSKGGGAPRSQVFDATRALLIKTWRAKLPKKYRDAAIEWVDNGLDSLMTIGTPDNEDLDESEDATPADEVLFWFYDSVDWPLALCEHWLRLAMIQVRKDWEKDLAKLGYAIKGKYLDKSDAHFIVAGDRIGHPDDDGVFWQLPEYAFTDYKELDAKTMKLVAAAKKKCACPWCAKK